MGYFNYFVRCVIRRFVRCFFNRKTFIFLLVLALILILSFKSFAYGFSTLSWQQISGVQVTSPTVSVDIPYTDIVNYHYVYKNSTASFYNNGGSTPASTFTWYPFVTSYNPNNTPATPENTSYVVPTEANYVYYFKYTATYYAENQISYANDGRNYIANMGVTGKFKSSNITGTSYILSDSATIWQGADLPFKGLGTLTYSKIFMGAPDTNYVFSFNNTMYRSSGSGSINFSLPVTLTQKVTPNTVEVYRAYVGNSTGGSGGGGNVDIDIDLSALLEAMQDIKGSVNSNSDTLTSIDNTLKELLEKSGNSDVIGGLENVSTSLGQQTDAINSQTESINQQTDAINSQTDSINQQTNTLKEQTDAINQQTDSINKQTDAINKTNDTLNDSNVTVETDLPTDNTNDITASGFDNVFNTIKNTFTSSSSQDLVVDIPFTGKKFTINFSNVYDGFNSGIVGTLINLFWWYMVSNFIVHDIYRKINSIKSGNIENIENTNIKEDLL